MKHYFFIVLFLMVVCSTAIFVLPSNAQADITRYVKVGGTGDGTSWVTASGTLQAMIDNTGTPCQIWVASGTYFPTSMHAGTNVRSLSFQMKNGVGIYGGFPNTGSPVWGDRDWEDNKTVLSGDIGSRGAITDNCYHVIFHPNGTNLNSTAVLDGFIIKSGNADGSGDNRSGGGMFNYKSSPTITNCTFTDNVAVYGGGICNVLSDPDLSDCTFASNTANQGGGIRVYEFYGTISNCIFTNNAAIDGAGLYIYKAINPTITNCTFSDNTATNWGGGIYILHAFITITNGVFSGNSASDGGGIVSEGGGEIALTNCTFSDNTATNWGGGIYSEQAEYSIINCTFVSNSASAGGGYYTQFGDLTLTNSILWGDSPDEIYSRFGGYSVTYSNIQDGIGQPWFGTGCIDTDPLWVNPDSEDFHLQSTSPCIDTGDNTAPNLSAEDFEGDPRIIDGNASGTPTVDMGVDEYGVKVGVYVTLQGDTRPISGWQVPLTLGFFEPGADVLTATPIYSFSGTTTMIVNGTTRAYFECPQSVAPGTYDITADTTTTLMNVKRLVGIW